MILGMFVGMIVMMVLLKMILLKIFGRGFWFMRLVDPEPILPRRRRVKPFDAKTYVQALQYGVCIIREKALL